MEEKLEEVKVKSKTFRCYKVDFSRLEKRKYYKAAAFPKVENIGHQLECEGIPAPPPRKDEYTHFVSIPLSIYPDLKEGYSELIKAIFSDKETAIDKDLLISPDKLHLTITMLTLYTKEEIQTAVKALEEAWVKILAIKDIQPIKITMKGLRCFGKKPEKTNIVYGNVVEDAGYEKLLKIGDIIIKSMIGAKILSKDELAHITYFPDQDKYQIDQLHSTLINSKFLAKKKAGKEKDYLFNATGILKYYGDFHLGDVTIQRMDLSKMNEFDPKTGYYLSEGSVYTKSYL